MGPVRLYIVLLLTAQFVIPLVPSWGAFVPHDHWSRTRLTPADWSAHVLEHQTAPVGANNSIPRAHSTDGTGIISTLTQNGLTSLSAPLADHAAAFEFATPPRAVLHAVLAHEFTARTLAYPPLNPPPTA